MKRVAGDQVKHRSGRGLKRTRIGRRNDVGAPHAIEELAGAGLEDDVISFANAPEDPEMGIAVSRDHGIAARPWHHSARQVPRAATQLAFIISFYYVQLSIEAGYGKFCHGVARMDAWDWPGNWGSWGFEVMGSHTLPDVRLNQIAGAHEHKRGTRDHQQVREEPFHHS